MTTKAKGEKLLEDNVYIVYCWRYEHQSICKIGKSIFSKFYDNSIKPALRFSVLDIEILGICLCDSKQARDKLELYLLDKRFNRVRSDREWVYLNPQVRDWIQKDCLDGNWTVEYFQKLENEYKEAHRNRNKEYQRKKRDEEILKKRARKMYDRYSAKSTSGLTVGGPTLARIIVAEDLEMQGVDASRIEELLAEIEEN